MQIEASAGRYKAGLHGPGAQCAKLTIKADDKEDAGSLADLYYALLKLLEAEDGSDVLLKYKAFAQAAGRQS